MVLSWIRKPVARKSRSQSRKAVLPARRDLHVEALENRMVPSATQTLGNLAFVTDGAFTSDPSGQVSTTSAVTVRKILADGSQSADQLRFDNGVQFQNGDTAGAFTALGEIWGVSKGQSVVDLAGGSSHSFSASDLIAKASSIADSKQLSVAGTTFALSNVGMTDSGLALQGSVSIAKLNGLTVSVTGNDSVLVDDAGVHLTGVNVNLPSFSFNKAGLQFDATNLNVHYNTALNEFDLSGAASATIAGQTVGVKFGTASSPGIVISNGDLQALKATLTTPSLTVGGLSLDLHALKVAYNAAAADGSTPEQITITGGTSATIAGQQTKIDLGGSINGVKTKGLVIQDGKLTALNAAVSTPSFNFGGATLDSTQMAMTYAAATPSSPEQITLSGGTRLRTRSGQDFAIQLGDAANQTAGLVIQNGQVTNLDATVSGKFNVGGLSVNSDGLHLAYAGGAHSTLTIDGGANFSLAGNTVGIKLGDRAHPGLVIQDGQLSSLSATLNADLKMFGLTLTAKDLTVGYIAAQNDVTIYGSLSLTAGTGDTLRGIKATLGDASNPGLDIINGKLSSLDVKLSGGFSLLGVYLQAQDLNVKYRADTGVVQLSGGVDLQLSKVLHGSVTLPENGITINTQNGAVQVNGFEVKFDVALGAFQIKDLDVKYSNTNGSVSVSASGQVMFPAGFAVGGNLTLKDGKVIDIGLFYDAGMTPGIAVGNTGLFVTYVAGSIKNLDSPADLNVKVDLGVTYGKKITVMGKTYAMFDGRGSVKVTKDTMDITGTVQFAGGVLGSGAATLHLDWANQIYSAHVSADIYYGIFHIEGDVTVKGDGTMTIDASGAIQVPTYIPVVGGTKLGGANVHLQYSPLKSTSDNVISGSAYATGIGQVEFSENFRGDSTANILGSYTKEVYQKIANTVAYVHEKFEVGRKMLSESMDSIGNQVKETWDWAGNHVKDTADWIGDHARETWDGVGNHVKDAWDWAGNHAIDTWDAVGNHVKETWDTAGTHIKDAFDRWGGEVKDIWDSTGKHVEQVFASGVQTLQKDFDAAGGYIETTFQNGVAGAKKDFDAAGHEIVQFLGSLGSVASDAGDAIEDGWDTFTSWF